MLSPYLLSSKLTVYVLRHVFLITECSLTNMLFYTTLCGGSLGSRVDEERSKLRELMWFAGHIDHRYLERILRLRFASVTTPVWGSVYITIRQERCFSYALLLDRFKYAFTFIDFSYINDKALSFYLKALQVYAFCFSYSTASIARSG